MRGGAREGMNASERGGGCTLVRGMVGQSMVGQGMYLAFEALGGWHFVSLSSLQPRRNNDRT